MSNEAIYIRELPTLDFIMKEINEEKVESGAGDSEGIGKLFYLLAAAQLVQILIGAVLSLFVAPASLFVSRTESEAFVWIVAAFSGVVMIALGVISIVLSIVSASAFRRGKNWRNSIGITTAGIALFAFPFATIAGGILLWQIFKARK